MSSDGSTGANEIFARRDDETPPQAVVSPGASTGAAEAPAPRLVDPDTVIKQLDRLEAPPYVTDVHALLVKAAESSDVAEKSALIEAWKAIKFAYIYVSNPRVQLRSEFLQCLYQETLAICKDPSRVRAVGDRELQVASYAAMLLVLLYECQPNRHSPLEVKVRVDLQTWAALKHMTELQYLAARAAVVFVPIPFASPGPAHAQRNLDTRAKRPLTRAHFPPNYGYYLDVGSSMAAASDREARRKARKLCEQVSAFQDMGGFEELDQALREYRKLRAALREEGVNLRGNVSPTFAVAAKAQFERGTHTKSK